MELCLQHSVRSLRFGASGAIRAGLQMQSQNLAPLFPVFLLVLIWSCLLLAKRLAFGLLGVLERCLEKGTKVVLLRS
jgi:hypothetical protein